MFQCLSRRAIRNRNLVDNKAFYRSLVLLGTPVEDLSSYAGEHVSKFWIRPEGVRQGCRAAASGQGCPVVAPQSSLARAVNPKGSNLAAGTEKRFLASFFAALGKE